MANVLGIRNEELTNMLPLFRAQFRWDWRSLLCLSRNSKGSCLIPFLKLNLVRFTRNRSFEFSILREEIVPQMKFLGLTTFNENVLFWVPSPSLPGRLLRFLPARWCDACIFINFRKCVGWGPLCSRIYSYQLVPLFLRVYNHEYKEFMTSHKSN